MNKLIPVAALAILLLAGCKDNSQDVEKLRADLAAQQKQFDEANDRWASERDTMRAEIDALKAKLGTLNEKDAKPVAERIKELEGRLADVAENPNDELAAKIDALDKKVSGVKEEAVEAAKLEAAKAATGEVDEEALAAMMAKKLAEEQAANAPTKDLAAALDRLDISDGEREQIRQEIIETKKGILEALEVPTEDGRVFAEELIDGFIKIQNGDAKESDMATLFLQLSTTKIPGDIEGRTYVQAIEALKTRNKESIGRILSPEDQKKLTAAHADWSDFEIGEGDPWGALYMERLQKYQAGKDSKD
jgi:outer membrane murein-binding lipoprotein Lpp